VAVSRTIFVAGAGIGGLTASLALAKKGFRAVVLEKAEKLEETGAGLQLSPNASRILVELGLEPRLAGRAVAPQSINIMSARAGGEICRLPLGEAATFRAGAPYWVVHRADLQAALLAQVEVTPDVELRLGCQFEDVTKHARGLTVVQRQGLTRHQDVANALIGADGIWSSVRHHLFPEVQPQFSGLIAWRGTLAATELPREYTSPRVQLWMGPNAHLVAYPISGRSMWWRSSPAPGTGPAGARRAKPTRSSRRLHRRAGPPPRACWQARSTNGSAGRCSPCRRMANGTKARSRCSAMLRMRCCRSRRKAPAWRSRMPQCWRNA
jgi:salicylate hydroxylase